MIDFNYPDTLDTTFAHSHSSAFSLKWTLAQVTVGGPLSKDIIAYKHRRNVTHQLFTKLKYALSQNYHSPSSWFAGCSFNQLWDANILNDQLTTCQRCSNAVIAPSSMLYHPSWIANAMLFIIKYLKSNDSWFFLMFQVCVSRGCYWFILFQTPPTHLQPHILLLVQPDQLQSQHHLPLLPWHQLQDTNQQEPRRSAEECQA